MGVKINSDNEQQTIALGQRLSQYLHAGDIVCLSGELGSGKTTFVKGLAKGLKINPKKVNSPTFVLMNIYEGKLPLFHFDLYRIDGKAEIENIGCEEFLYDEGISVIEWAEKLGELSPKQYMSVKFNHKDEHRRAISLNAEGARYKNILSKF